MVKPSFFMGHPIWYGPFYAKFVSVLDNEDIKRQRYLERNGKSQCSSEEETKF